MLKTTITVRYPAELGTIGLRGDHGPLSWTASLPPSRISEDNHVFVLDLEDGEVLEFKPIRNEREWSCERNYTLLAGDNVTVEPYFDFTVLTIESSVRQLDSPELGRPVRFQVLLPPSYDEHHRKHYPVLYAQDGHALFTTGVDPMDGSNWKMDDTLNQLYELGVIEELIVVGVFTDQDRLEMLSPTRDPVHGGGGGPKYLNFLADTLKPWIDRNYRTLSEAANTGLMGSSMGGLFSFFAAWTRPDIFGKAACLSGSFWWDRRCMVREVRKGYCPAPRPVLYIDSGAARSSLEEDANVRDGLHHTIALRHALVSHCYVPGSPLHTLAFPGHRHDSASWGARLAVPLQLLFPRRA